jgi:hypothetical protein
MGLLGAQVPEALLFSLFVLIGNPLIVMVIMGALGYRKRTGFLAGLTVAQISEFSLILAALGSSLGHIGPETVGLITLVGLVTISASTYMILYSATLYSWLDPWLGVFERRHPHREAIGAELPGAESADVVLFGLGRYRFGIAEALRARGCRVLGVDYNPELVNRGDAGGNPVYYGDAGDPEFIAVLPTARMSWVASTVRDHHVNQTLVQSLRAQCFRGHIALPRTA